MLTKSRLAVALAAILLSAPASADPAGGTQESYPPGMSETTVFSAPGIYWEPENSRRLATITVRVDEAASKGGASMRLRASQPAPERGDGSGYAVARSWYQEMPIVKAATALIVFTHGGGISVTPNLPQQQCESIRNTLNDQRPIGDGRIQASMVKELWCIDASIPRPISGEWTITR